MASDDLLFIISGATSDNRLIILDIGLPAYITLSDTYSSIAPSGGSFSAPENDNNNVKTIAAAVASVGVSTSYRNLELEKLTNHL